MVGSDRDRPPPTPRAPRARPSAAFVVPTATPRRNGELYPRVVDPDAPPTPSVNHSKRAPGTAPDPDGRARTGRRLVDPEAPAQPARKTPAKKVTPPAGDSPTGDSGPGKEAPAKKAPASPVVAEPELLITVMCSLGRHSRCRGRVYAENPQPGMETVPCQCPDLDCWHHGVQPGRRGRPKGT